MMIELDEDVAIQHVTEHLKTSHGDTHTPDEIDSAVAAACASLETVPVLVERRARSILVRAHRLNTDGT
ncbi:three-helix bundle dimerization domain-containing protein [Streptomyces sp. NPDC002817]|uniref:three-helix bundle dimerization domain-containing protein n=1 Tax=Streptomyces sp. NPDC088357 TaxID=3154655 RepID=UPI00341DB6E1